MSRPHYNPTMNEDFQQNRKEALEQGHARLFAIALYAEPDCIQWRHAKDDAALDAYLESLEEEEGMALNCAIPVVAVNPQDSDETINEILTADPRRFRPRDEKGTGFFSHIL